MKQNQYSLNTWSSIMNDPFFIGFDRLTNRISSSFNNQQNPFPPYNVRKFDDNTFVIELALAGFSKNDLTITESGGVLTIEGSKHESDEEYLHKGIAGRKFMRNFTLGEYISVSSADLTDGMLYVVLKREIPEAAKPRVIDIH